jgi:short-chain fatty acids transporter
MSTIRALVGGPSNWVVERLRGLGEWFSDWSLRYMPDPYVIAILLTFTTFGAALVTGTAPKGAFDAWYDGVWTLLPFMATLSVMLMAGDAIAKSPSVTRVLERIAALPNSRFTAVWFTSFVAMSTALISWAIGLIVGAIMAKRVAFEMREKGIEVHYPLLAAAGYTSLMIFHSGLTASAALLMADASLIPATFPEQFRVVIPISETVGSPVNILTAGLELAIIPVVMAAMHPKTDIHELPRDMRSEIATIVESEPDTTPQPEEAAYQDPELTVADKLNNSWMLGLLIAIFPIYYVVNTWFLRAGGLSNLTLNSINALFLFGAIVLWRTPIRIVNQMKDSVSNISGIIFLFPFYAGIAGLLTNTGLASMLTRFFAQQATPATWPLIGITISAVVNVFIPSGGGQWVAQGPILMETTQQFGMPLSTAVLLEMLGDSLTNMIQPFWAIPLLAIANLRARDIIGYTAVAMVVGFVIVGTTVTVFLGM